MQLHAARHFMRTRPYLGLQSFAQRLGHVVYSDVISQGTGVLPLPTLGPGVPSRTGRSCGG